MLIIYNYKLLVKITHTYITTHTHKHIHTQTYVPLLNSKAQWTTELSILKSYFIEILALLLENSLSK